MAKKKSSDIDLGDVLLYGFLGVGGIAIIHSLFKPSQAPAATPAAFLVNVSPPPIPPIAPPAAPAPAPIPTTPVPGAAAPTPIPTSAVPGYQTPAAIPTTPVPGYQAPAPAAAAPAPAANVQKMAVATKGAPYNINSIIVPGYTTIVEFAATWCHFCQGLKPKLEQLVNSRPDVVLRLMDMTDKNSQASAQAIQEFNIQTLPYIRVYGPTGQFKGEVASDDISQIQALL